MKFIKKYSKHIFLFISMFILLENVSAAGFENGIDQKYVICNNTEIPYGVPYIVHNIVNVIKVGIPVILIIMGMIDFLKAVIASDEKQMKDSASIFIRRTIAAVIVFLTFSIVQFAFNLIDDGAALSCINCFINDECGTVYTYEEDDADDSSENDEEESNTFNLQKIPGESYETSFETYESYATGSYICKSDVVSYIKDYKDANARCTELYLFDADAKNNCALTMKPIYYVTSKNVSSCSELCEQYPNDIKCIN